MSKNWLTWLKPQKATAMKSQHLPASPPFVLAMSFAVFIIIGTILFKLPFATRAPITWFDAFFTAASAVTVTGLMVIEPASILTIPGQFILMLLVQVGGLGIVTFTVLAAITLGKRISISQQVLALEAFNQTNVSRIRQTAFAVFKISLFIQLTAIVVLGWWWSATIPVSEAFYRSLFHVTMAFNNAGLDLYEHSLIGMTNDKFSIFMISALIALGGLGFPVIINVLQRRRWSLFSPYTKAILIGTISLNIVGFLAIWSFEHSNSATIGTMDWREQATASWLQIISSRTAGFVAMDPSEMRDSSILLIMLYMFIGGGSLSTASGIKVGTFIVLIAAVISYLRHREEVVLLGRSILPETVQKSLSLVLITFSWFFIGLLFITIFDNMPLRSVMFEVMSAITTTGMSFGITNELSTPSQVVLIVLMFAGRLGPLTLVYSLATRRRSRIRYPEGHFQVG